MFVVFSVFGAPFACAVNNDCCGFATQIRRERKREPVVKSLVWWGR